MLLRCPIVLRSDRKTLYWCVYIIHTHSYPSAHLHAAPSNLRSTKGTSSIPEGPLSSPFNPTLITLIASYTPLVSMSPSNTIAKYPLVPLVGVCAAPLWSKRTNNHLDNRVAAYLFQLYVTYTRTAKPSGRGSSRRL
jgi:hypothetical protein